MWHDSGESEEHLLEIGSSKNCSCWIITGYLSGFTSFCTGKKILFKEIMYKTKGDKHCFATGKDEKSWKNEFAELESLYISEDIESKVKALTEEIKNKNRIIRKHAQEGDTSKPLFMEIYSKKFKNTMELAHKVSEFDSPVLITGETGTGKDYLAKYIHRNSPRNKGPFIAINCNALPDTLLESELFGHKAGAFTGSIGDRKGLFEEAQNGTLLLDEIGDISIHLQAKLLRAIQKKEITRLGENKPRKINTRILSATNKNLEKAISAGTFREDLYYRIRVIEITVPALRDRKEDILALVRHFLALASKKLNLKKATIDFVCFDYLTEYKWPGNIRELENTIERACILSGGSKIKPEHLPPSITSHELPVIKQNSGATLAELEKLHIERILKSYGGKQDPRCEKTGNKPDNIMEKAQTINTRGRNPALPEAGNLSLHVNCL